jgi:hypothetical protein
MGDGQLSAEEAIHNFYMPRLLELIAITNGMPSFLSL